MILATDRSVGEDQRRSWCDQRADILQKRRVYRDAACQVFQVRWFFANTSCVNPLTPASRINRRQSRIDVCSGETSCLDPSNRRPADFDAVAIDVTFAVRSAYDDRNWSLRRHFRPPYEAAAGWHGPRLSRKEQARAEGLVRSTLVIGDDDSRADPGNRVKLRRDIHRQSNAARGRRIAR